MKTFLFIAAVLAIGLAESRAIVTASGFQAPNPWVTSGNYNGGAPIDAQLSGLGMFVPYGSFDAPSIGFAGWEKFSAGGFAGLSPQYAGDSGLLSASLAQERESIGLSSTGTTNAGQITVAGTDYYGRLTCGLDDYYDFSLTATASAPVSSVTLAIKHSNFYTVEDPEDPGTWTQVAPFSATLDGIASSPAVWAPGEGASAFGNFSDAVSMGLLTRYYVYTWSVDLEAGESFSIGFASMPETLGFGFSVDTIGLSVQSVPEPSVFALAGIGLAGLLWRLRRRS